jgi:toxin ParE1/3/4
VAGKFRVEITATAEADVADIWESIAQDDPDMASAFILRMQERIGGLERFPERRARVPESHLLGERYRHLLFGQYRAIFMIAGDRVIVMRVPHGARLLDTKLLEEKAR